MREVDFFIDGDLDPIDIIFPSPDGFEQDVIRFDRKNGSNADIVAAAKMLLPEVRDPSAASSLVRLIEDLSPQDAVASRRKSVPARHRVWKPLHELSVDVLRGLGLNYQKGKAHSPGYLVNTWRVWEDLLTVSARLGFGSSAVLSQKGYHLGTKMKMIKGNLSELSVYPDCVIESDGTRPRFLLDAKYKGHVERGQVRINEADIYEALAFSRAAKCNLVALAYPAQLSDTPQSVGTCVVFEKVEVDAVQIVGIQVETRMISCTGALKLFSANMAAGIAKAFL